MRLNILGLHEYTRQDLFIDATDEVREADRFYIMTEADKVIKDITEGAMSMFREANRCRGLDTKSSLGRIADVAFKHWNRVENTMSNNRQLRLDKAELLRSNEYLRTRLNEEMRSRLTDKLEYSLKIRHSNRKRCLAMAKMCKSEADAAFLRYNWDSGRYADVDFYEKWSEIWLALAEEPTWAKFLQLIRKEAK